MPYRSFFGRNKTWQTEQDKKKQEDKDGKQSEKAEESKTAKEQAKEPESAEKDQEPAEKQQQSDSKSKSEEKKPGSSSSSSSESSEDELSKEDIEKIKTLFSEQEAEIKSLEKQIKSHEKKIDELKALTEKQKKEITVVRVEYTKQVKENEGTVKRYRKMIEDEKQFAISKFAKDLLEVRDALRLGIDNVDMEQIKSIEDLEALQERFKAGHEGSIMTAEVMDRVLERFKVVHYDPKGEKFDATLHEAVFTISQSKQENNTIEVVMQTGWKIGERVLRAAKVGIVKK